jgi:hypothetical protein
MKKLPPFSFKAIMHSCELPSMHDDVIKTSAWLIAHNLFFTLNAWMNFTYIILELHDSSTIRYTTLKQATIGNPSGVAAAYYELIITTGACTRITILWDRFKNNTSTCCNMTTPPFTSFVYPHLAFT